MPELKPARSYHELLRRIGIQNPGEVGVATPVQLTIPVDVGDHLVAPIQVAVAGGLSFTSAAVGDRGGIEIEARAGGIWVEYIDNQNGDVASILVSDASVATVIETVAAVVTNFGPPAQSILREVRTSAFPAGSHFQMGTNDIIQGMPFFVARGQFFSVYRATTNNTALFNVFWREVPVGGLAFEGPTS